MVDPIEEAAYALERRMLKEPFLVEALKRSASVPTERLEQFLREAAMEVVDSYRGALNIPRRTRP